ncbi:MULTISPECIES: hypothetical protein [Hymenobacter]|uniref:Uncharacterized protein n=1 Tax=Hymenobacter mucosus TaxID=1411120 RepID=A0A238V5V9_9BACT|nr:MULTISPECIES: hypothetical protein [Hymenobacter]SNR29601.1 hypothetical protein SAMN06269173_101165 [Hymenobacter mucosus]
MDTNHLPNPQAPHNSPAPDHTLEDLLAFTSPFDPATTFHELAELDELNTVEEAKDLPQHQDE